MKKGLLIATAVLALASCTKDWTCNCKTTTNLGSTSTKTDSKFQIKDKKRSEAKDYCKTFNVESNIITTKCNLK